VCALQVEKAKVKELEIELKQEQTAKSRRSEGLTDARFQVWLAKRGTQSAKEQADNLQEHFGEAICQRL